ncbi:MAG: winged helix-turn-helix domain-containing protein [Candidatus Levyibacteriota bacterium]
MLKDLITSKTRVKLLLLFLDDPSAMYHVREIVRRVSEEINAVRRELILLEKKGILTREPRANRVYYYLDKNYPFYFDLVRLHGKTNGLGADIIKNRVKLGKIKYAMLSGKFVRKTREDADAVDLLIIGTVVLPELTLIVKQEEAKRGAEINYTVMTEEEFIFRKKRLDPFINGVISGSRIMLIGDEESMLS